MKIPHESVDRTSQPQPEWMRPLLAAVPLVAGVSSASAEPPVSPANIFAPVSTPAYSIFGLSVFVLGVTAAIFAVVFSLLVYAAVKFRRRRDDDGSEPAQVYGSNQVEIAWTVVPILVVVALFMATARVIAGIQGAPRPAESVEFGRASGRRYSGWPGALSYRIRQSNQPRRERA